MTTNAMTRPPAAPTRVRRLLDHPDTRRLGVSLALGVLVAIVTGPQGRPGRPTYAVTQALHPGRLSICLGLAVLAWLLLVTRERYATSIRAVLDRVRPPPLPARARTRPARLGGYAAALLVAVVVPMHLGDFWQGVLVEQIGIYVLLALGLNVVVGFAGLLDLGYVAFYAIGAYATAYFTGTLPVQPPFELNPFFVIPFAVAAAMLAGLVLGAPTLRLRGDYLAIVTLGFGEIVTILAVNLGSVTNGARGAFGVPSFSLDVPGVHYEWGLTSLPYYYLLLGFVVVLMAAFRLLENSRVGRAWTAIREDEVAAQACGIPPVKYKLMAFAIGASASGFAGVLFAAKVSFISPSSFALTNSILVLALVIFGGMGSIWGAMVGAAILQWFPQFLQKHDVVPLEDRFIYFGALLIIMMIFRPQGLIPSRRRAREIRLAEHGVGGADAMGAPAGSPTT